MNESGQTFVKKKIEVNVLLFDVMVLKTPVVAIRVLVPYKKCRTSSD